jgi:hypothetical protein
MQEFAAGKFHDRHGVPLDEWNIAARSASFWLNVGRADHLTHFSVSSAMCLPNSVAEPTSAVPLQTGE